MITCKICQTEVSENDTFCNVCNYPLQGTKKEQATFVARQIIQKSDVEESIEKLKKSRIVLFVFGAFYAIVPFTPLIESSSTFHLIISIAFGLLFIGFGFLSFKKPKLALLIPLTLVVSYYFILLITNPLLLYIGIIWKIIIVLVLGYGYFSVRKSDKILKENKYLASKLGFDQIKNK